MLTGKQRRHLRSLAHKVNPVTQIGKNGLSDNLFKTLDDALEAHELIKVSVLQNCLLDKDEITESLTNELEAERVQQIGNQIVLYRESSKEKQIELP
ncbi:ribosome assembly RNA-binding protein YhbY [Haloplasma contractile]|uniref:RNA-binding protein YqeI n=1 Tax=Haloplasma contractile SSD-17B TaxID=1033810 RepID=U2DZW6_9MOLU|nr:ribosome assembly RNA-binding protein YhbY [Haloplasma contractile]ERJ13727.1 putative RNA-binding protein YqeI [Haloplasma contractile SSD-17B]